MDRSTARIAFTALTIATIVVLGGCMDASLSQSGNAPASISIQDAPSTLGDIDLTVSGPGMADINESVSRSTDAVVLEVPIGPDRSFEFLGPVTLNTTAFYDASSTVGVPSRGVSVAANMRLSSNIIATSPFGFRVYTIDDMTGANFQEVVVPYFYDLDFDEFGRAYLSSVEADTSGAGAHIERYDDPMSGASDISFPDFPADAHAYTVAVDREAGWVYYAGYINPDIPGSRYLARSRYDGSDAEQLDISGVPTEGFEDVIRGIAVDQSTGHLYLLTVVSISRYDPDTETVLASNVFSDTFQEVYDEAVDVRMWRGRPIALLQYTEELPAIIGFDAELNVSGGFGSVVPFGDVPDNDGEFERPHKFVATLNRRIYVAENRDYAAPTDPDLIVAVDDLSGSGWETTDAGGSFSFPESFGGGY